MNVDAVDRLIQIGFAEGVIATHGLYEHVVCRRTAKTRIAQGTMTVLIRRLEDALALSHDFAEMPLTVGAFLRDVRVHGGLNDLEVSTRLDVSKATYRMMESDKISPLKIHPRTWRKLMSLAGLSPHKLEGLIRTTCTVRWLGPSMIATMARYSPWKQGHLKMAVMKSAAKELLLRSGAVLPPDEEQKVGALMKKISFIN